MAVYTAGDPVEVHTVSGDAMAKNARDQDRYLPQGSIISICFRGKETSFAGP